MRKHYLLVALSIICGLSPSFAQMVGTNIYLQGRYLEIGHLNNGAFGIPPGCGGAAPAGYHPFPAGTGLGEVYDFGLDGWTVGTPPYFGDYTYPGTPFEGWSLEVNGLRNQAFQYGAYCPGTYGGGGGSLTGGSVSYTNIGGRAIANWAGTASGGNLIVRQETRVDTLASWVVVTTYFRNTSSAAIPGVYYLRTTDPDNELTRASSFVTNNAIVHQNDAQHRVMVSSRGVTYTNAYLALGTKDCRAKAFIYDVWYPLPPTASLAQMHAGTLTGFGTFVYTGTRSGDIGIGLVYNIGTIAPGDSAIISYAYIFNGDAGIDQAFPDPELVLNGRTIFTHPDTFNTCDSPGMLRMPADIRFGDDKCWSWSKWTWAPSAGLSATTGTSVMIDFSGLSGPTTFTVTGVDSATGMQSCNTKVFTFTILPCHTARDNDPCVNDTLRIWNYGDSTGATYAWTGPGGFTSTRQYNYIYPARFSDSGLYKVIITRGSIRDTDSTYVNIRPLPVVNITSNAPLCKNALDTLKLNLAPTVAGDRYTWWGPVAFTSSVQNPIRVAFDTTMAGFYGVQVTSRYGCKSKDSAYAGHIAPPPAPIILNRDYCQGETFVPYVVTGTTGTVLWWSTATGGISTTTAPVINTAVAGGYRVWASQKVGSCESNRGTNFVKVTVTPPAPLVAGTMAYCQFIGPVVPLTVTTTATGVARWYTVPTGGTFSLTQPLANINVAGNYNFWVSQVDSGCEGPRRPVTVTIHPKPAPPSITPWQTCQYIAAGPLVATPLAGHTLTWYGPGITSTGTSVAPTPDYNVPGIDTYFVTQTSPFGCISDSAMHRPRVIPEPAPPVTQDTSYCQYSGAPLLVAIGAPGSTIKWYADGPDGGAPGGILLPGNPRAHNTLPGDSVWYATQVVAGCESRKAAIKVTTLYKPDFNITPVSPWVCQYDSITLAYDGTALVDPGYSWVFPEGGSVANGSLITDSVVTVKFDSATQDNYVYLKTTNYKGRCFGIDTIRVKIIPQPTAQSYTNRDVCIGDTVRLALGNRSDNAQGFVWEVDFKPFASNNILTIVSHNSNSGGPFLIKWNDTGSHIIVVKTQTIEGCKSAPINDTIHVHALPDARFKFTTRNGQLCLEDSVLFEAKEEDYRYSYEWTPARFFNYSNEHAIWGKVLQAQSEVTLKVTDPFGCYASTSQVLNPSSCCTVTFPNAFTPNGDTRNDVFRPIFDGFHRFNVFRIANRWGQTIFESGNTDAAWDGTFNGVPQDMGVYYYYLKYDCGSDQGKQDIREVRGDVTLIR